MRKWKTLIVTCLTILAVWLLIPPALVNANQIPDRPIDTTVVDDTQLLFLARPLQKLISLISIGQQPNKVYRSVSI